MLKELDRVKDELKSMEKKFQKRTVSRNKNRTLFKFVKAKKTILNWYSLKGSLVARLGPYLTLLSKRRDHPGKTYKNEEGSKSFRFFDKLASSSATAPTTTPTVLRPDGFATRVNRIVISSQN